LNWVLAVIVFVALLVVVRLWIGARLRAGRLSRHGAAITVAAVWGVFPFLGLVAGAPWSAPAVVVISALLFTSVLIGAEFLLGRYGIG